MCIMHANSKHLATYEMPALVFFKAVIAAKYCVLLLFSFLYLIVNSVELIFAAWLFNSYIHWALSICYVT